MKKPLIFLVHSNLADGLAVAYLEPMVEESKVIERSVPLKGIFQRIQVRPAHLTWVVLLSLLYFSWMLGDRPFAHPDEGRYVEIPREMLATNDWLTPRLNGVKYFEKPILFYWLQAIVMKFLGLSEFTMRLVTMLMGALGAVATFLFARHHFGLRAAWIAFLILLTSPLYFSMAHMITLDMTVSVFVSLALLTFYQAMASESGFKRRLFFYLFTASCALGVLTKGLMALAIPGPVIVLWLTWTRNWGHLRPFYPFSSFLLFMTIVAPWHIWVGLENPEFFYKYFMEEHVLRYLTNMHSRYQPPWFFIPVLLLGMLPWVVRIFTAALRVSMRASGNEMPEDVNLKKYLILWASWVFLFFSVCNSKLIPYVLPAFIPLALLLGQLRWSSFQLLSFGAVAFFLNQATILVAPYFQKPSVKPLLENVYIPQNERLVSYMVYFQDLPVYAQRIVSVVSAKGELTFGCDVEDCSSWMMEMPRFLELWQEKDRLWVVMKQEDYETFRRHHPQFKIYEQKRTDDYVLITNQPKELS